MSGPVSKKNKSKTIQADDLDDDFGGLLTSTLPASDNEDSDDDDMEDSQRGEPKALVYSNEGVLLNKTVFMRKPRKSKEMDGSDMDEDEDDEDEEDEDEDGDGEEDEEENEEDEDGEEEENDEDEDGEECENEGDNMIIVDEDANEGNIHEDEDALDQETAGLNHNDNESEIAEEKGLDEAVQTESESTSSIPFTFKAPTCHADLLQIMEGRNAQDQATIIHRIRVLYHVKLGGENRKKLEVRE
jgi:hypothetical protein